MADGPELAATLSLDKSDFDSAIQDAESEVQGLSDSVSESGDAATSGLSGMASSLDGVAKGLKPLGKEAGIAGAALTGLATGGAMSFANTGEQIELMSEKTGMSTETLSAMKYVLEANGSSLDSMQTSFRMMAHSLDAPTKQSTAALKDLGLTLADLKAMSPEQAFITISTKLGQMKDAEQRSTDATALLGRTSLNMIPAFIQLGTQGMDAVKQKTKDMGLMFDTTSTTSAVNLYNALFNLKESTLGLVQTIGKDLAPMLTNLIHFITNIIEKITGWIEKHPAIAKAIMGLGLILMGAGGFIMALNLLAKAIDAVNMAMLVWEGLSSPLKIAISLAAIAAGAGIIYGLTKSFTGGTPTPTAAGTAAEGAADITDAAGAQTDATKAATDATGLDAAGTAALTDATTQLTDTNSALNDTLQATTPAAATAAVAPSNVAVQSAEITINIANHGVVVGEGGMQELAQMLVQPLRQQLVLTSQRNYGSKVSL